MNSVESANITPTMLIELRKSGKLAGLISLVFKLLFFIMLIFCGIAVFFSLLKGQVSFGFGFGLGYSPWVYLLWRTAKAAGEYSKNVDYVLGFASDERLINVQIAFRSYLMWTGISGIFMLITLMVF